MPADPPPARRPHRDTPAQAAATQSKPAGPPKRALTKRGRQPANRSAGRPAEAPKVEAIPADSTLARPGPPPPPEEPPPRDAPPTGGPAVEGDMLAKVVVPAKQHHR